MTEMNSRPLSASVRRGALWNVATTLVLRLANILITAIVARILDPRDFGVYAVALTAFAIVSALGELGVASCLIRADIDIDSLAPTMVTVSLTTSAILAGAMVAFARPIAAALGSAYAAGPVKVMALAVLLTGIFAVPGAQLVRDFKQDKLFLANVISFVPSTVALLLLAKTGSGAMAFAWSRVLGQLVVGCVLIASVPKIYWPGLARSALLLLLRFGLPLAGANFVNYILLNVDYALVGRLMGAVALGTYVLAFNVASWPSNLLGTMINNVAMPAFSRVKHDVDLFHDAIVNAQRSLSLVVMPMCGAIMAFARPLVLTLYSAKWAASADVLPFLSVYSAISIICVLFANILASMGHTRILLVVQLVWLAELAPAMALGVRRDGIVGAAFAHIAIIAPIVLPCYLLAMKRTTGVRLGSLAKATLPALLASAVAALAARGMASQFSSPLAQLITGLSIYGLVYVVAIAPQAITLLNQEQATKLGLGRILRLYNMTARWIGLPDRTPPKHRGKSGGGGAQPMSSGGLPTVEEVSSMSANSARRAWGYGTTLGRPYAGAPNPLERYAARFDDVFSSLMQRRRFREYLVGLLGPRDWNNTLTALAREEPPAGAQHPAVQRLQFFLLESRWDPERVNARRLELLRADPATAPHEQGVLVIEDSGGDREGRMQRTRVGRKWLSRYRTSENEVVTVTTVWADERLYYPLHAVPYPPREQFDRVRSHPESATKLQVGAGLAVQARAAGFAFRAVVADCIYHQGEPPGELAEAGLPYVTALKPHHGSWAYGTDADTPLDAARALAWHGPGDPGDWRPVTRAFRDGHTETWFAADAHLGGWGPDGFTRLVVATADPATLPPRATWYLATNLPRPDGPHQDGSPHAAAGLAEIVRIYGIRHWIEQSYSQVKNKLGWADFQASSDTAICRHQALVSCAFCFCWDTWFADHSAPDAAVPPLGPSREERETVRRTPAFHAPGDPGIARLAFPLDRVSMLVTRTVERASAPAATSPEMLESAVLADTNGVSDVNDDTIRFANAKHIRELAGTDGVSDVSDDTMQFASIRKIEAHKP